MVVDLLALADDTKSDQVLRSVDFARAQGLRELARYDAETAGGLMTTEFVAVPEDAHVSDAIKLIKSPGSDPVQMQRTLKEVARRSTSPASPPVISATPPRRSRCSS